mmetsp:Transcript_84228/g.154595  ORF Transcript_84228/g.154595 Transcript_84228/m.154595 type:complete len:245 (-) Transcript_84228:492-1226(-)
MPPTCWAMFLSLMLMADSSFTSTDSCCAMVLTTEMALCVTTIGTCGGKRCSCTSKCRLGCPAAKDLLTILQSSRIKSARSRRFMSASCSKKPNVVSWSRYSGDFSSSSDVEDDSVAEALCSSLSDSSVSSWSFEVEESGEVPDWITEARAEARSALLPGSTDPTLPALSVEPLREAPSPPLPESCGSLSLMELRGGPDATNMSMSKASCDEMEPDPEVCPDFSEVLSLRTLPLFRAPLKSGSAI